MLTINCEAKRENFFFNLAILTFNAVFLFGGVLEIVHVVEECDWRSEVEGGGDT